MNKQLVNGRHRDNYLRCYATVRMQQRDNSVINRLLRFGNRFMTAAFWVGGLLMALLIGSFAAVATKIEYEEYQAKPNVVVAKQEHLTLQNAINEGQEIFERCVGHRCGIAKKLATAFGK